MDVQSFYGTMAGVSLALLGLWWVVLQLRTTWRRLPSRRALAYAVTLQFVLPGAMSILSMVAPDQSLIWRSTFAASGITGVIATLTLIRVLREDHVTPRVIGYFQWLALPAYLLVILDAVLPLQGSLPLGLSPIQLEGIALTIIVFLGMLSATVLLVELGLSDEDAHHRPAADADAAAALSTIAERTAALEIREH